MLPDHFRERSVGGLVGIERFDVLTDLRLQLLGFAARNFLGQGFLRNLRSIDAPALGLGV